MTSRPCSVGLSRAEMAWLTVLVLPAVIRLVGQVWAEHVSHALAAPFDRVALR